MLAVLTKLDDGCAGQGPMFKPKRLLPVQKTLAEARAPSAAEEYRGGSLKALAPGVNKGVCVNVRAALDATAEDMLNLHYIVVDGDGTLAALSVYGLEDGAVRQSSTLTLLDPNVKDVDATWEGRRFKFRLVRVDLPKQILVGGPCRLAWRGRGLRASTCNSPANITSSTSRAAGPRPTTPVTRRTAPRGT